MRLKYKKKRLADGRLVEEHRYIMECILGRKLLRSEIVHHIDGNSLNNSIDNLQIMTQSEHNKLHNHSSNLTHVPPETLKGEDAVNSKLTEELVREIKAIFKDSRKGIRSYARSIGVAHPTVIKVLDGTSWAHVQ